MMNKVIWISIGALFLGALACKNGSAQSNFSDEKVREMLVRFYSAHIKVRSVQDRNTRDSIDNIFYSNDAKKAQSNHGSDSLEEHYWEYIKENAALQRKKSDSILYKFLSAKLYSYIKHVNDQGLVLDYDPFTKSQIIDAHVLKTLKVKKDQVDFSVYYVSYTDRDGATTIKLKVVEENGVYRIDHVFMEGVDE